MSFTIIKAIMRREWQRIKSRKTLWALILVMPFVVFFSLAPIYERQAVRELPLGVIDHDRSTLSRIIVRSLESSPTFALYGYYDDLQTVEKDFKKGKLQAAIVIPENLEKDLKSGKSAHVVFLKNSANIIVGNVAYKAAMTTLQTLSIGMEMRKFQAGGASSAQALERAHPIAIETLPLYNPFYNYETYLVGGLLPIMLQMVVLIASVLVFSSELKEGTVRELWRISEGNMLNIVVGKSLPHLFLHLSNVFLLTGIVFTIFQIPVQGSLFLLLAYLFLFVVSVFFVGLFISCLFRNNVLATEAAIFISTPAFIFTGYTFPLEAMPWLHRFYAHLLPSTYFMTGYLKIFSMGEGWHGVLPEAGALFLFLLIGFGGTLLLMFFRKRQMTATGMKKLEATP
ncbi:ABC transporter permease [Caldithrix abyssi]